MELCTELRVPLTIQLRIDGNYVALLIRLSNIHHATLPVHIWFANSVCLSFSKCQGKIKESFM